MSYLEISLSVIILFLVIILYLFFKKRTELPNKQEAFEKHEIEINEQVQEETTSNKEEKTVNDKDIITKREVPLHGKISKDDFKEFAGTKILAAEDNLINQKVIKSLFIGTGIDITIADNGQEALDILKTNQEFTIVLMDANMPIMDGFEATRTIRSNSKYSHIAVIGLSGDTAVDDIKKMREAGMEECLAKPINLNALYDVLYKYTPERKETIIEKEKEAVEIDNTPSAIELNIEKGLDICADDKNFYLEILQEFINNYSDSGLRLQELLNQGDSVHADRKLLDIVGITANIGADNLHDTAQKLKNAINNSQEKEYIPLLEKYEAHLYKLIKEIRNYR